MKTVKPRIAWILHGIYKNEGRVYKESHTLADSGYEVTIFATARKGLSKVEYEGNVRIERLDLPILRKLHIPLYKTKLLMPFYTLKLLLKLRKFNMDFIHCMNLWTLHIGFLASKLFNAKYIYDSHDLFVGQNHMNNVPSSLRKLIMVYENFFAKRAEVVLQTTNSRGKQFQKWYGIKPFIIKNKSLAPNHRRYITPNLLPQPLKRAKKIIGYVGSIQPYRGIEQLILAVSGMKFITVVLLGRSDNPWAKKFLEDNKEKVIWIPPVEPEKVTIALKILDLGITLIQNSCLSYYQSCPTKVFELIVADVPQVASDFPEIRNVVVENPVGPVGRVVNPADVTQIRTAIFEMLNSPEEMEIYRKNCSKLQSKCIWRSEGRKLVNIYKSLK